MARCGSEVLSQLQATTQMAVVGDCATCRRVLLRGPARVSTSVKGPGPGLERFVWDLVNRVVAPTSAIHKVRT
jgi:hypothetical protein